jgi:manganese oxidase
MIRWIALLFCLSVVAGYATGALAKSVTYNLYATDGYTELADGTRAYIYGFVGGRDGSPITYQTSYNGTNAPQVSTTSVPAPTAGPETGNLLAGNAQFPAPIIYATVGDVVTIRFKNLGVAANPRAPNDPHSIHLHGVDVNAANDGVPETSVGAIPANGLDPGAGNVIVYMFTAEYPGTYMYHCHQEADIHVNMGMYGALVIYNRGDAAGVVGPGKGKGGTLFSADYDKDFVLLLSEFDVRGHQDEEGTYIPQSWDPNPWNWAQYKPQYWFINGISFPQTIHVASNSGLAYSNWLAAHPGYETLISGSVSKYNRDWRTRGEKVLIRVINMGFETQPMHMHGFHGKILGSDQRDWGFASQRIDLLNVMQPFGKGMEKQTLTIGSGETYEWLIDFGQQALNSNYPSGTTPDPGTLPVPGISGVNYVGNPVKGIIGGYDPLNMGSQLFPFHNHDDYKATNNGAYPGGMFTMLSPLP